GSCVTVSEPHPPETTAPAMKFGSTARQFAPTAFVSGSGHEIITGGVTRVTLNEHGTERFPTASTATTVTVIGVWTSTTLPTAGLCSIVTEPGALSRTATSPLTSGMVHPGPATTAVETVGQVTLGGTRSSPMRNASIIESMAISFVPTITRL